MPKHSLLICEEHKGNSKTVGRLVTWGGCEEQGTAFYMLSRSIKFLKSSLIYIPFQNYKLENLSALILCLDE